MAPGATFGQGFTMSAQLAGLDKISSLFNSISVSTLAMPEKLGPRKLTVVPRVRPPEFEAREAKANTNTLPSSKQVVVFPETLQRCRRAHGYENMLNTATMARITAASTTFATFANARRKPPRWRVPGRAGLLLSGRHHLRVGARQQTIGTHGICSTLFVLHNVQLACILIKHHHLLCTSYMSK